MGGDSESRGLTLRDSPGHLLAFARSLEEVGCNYCGATMGTPCDTSDGALRMRGRVHNARIAAYASGNQTRREQIWANVLEFEQRFEMPAPERCAVKSCDQPSVEGWFVTTHDDQVYGACKTHGANYVRSEDVRREAEPVLKVRK